MRNIRLTIEYDGSKYKGWQRLGDSTNTIQYKIENVLSLLTEENVNIIASGRTDAGVHANKQVANFKTNCKASVIEILDYCYKYLPNDIVIKNVEEVDHLFHSRYNVKEKVYKYNICNGYVHNVFERKYSYHVKEKLNVEKMREASLFFIGKHDFASFTSLKSKKKSTVREIYSIDIMENNNNVNIIFNGNGFLYNMVRIIVGTLIEIGLGNLQPEAIVDMLEKKDRSVAGPTAPAQGLFLMDVIY